jgi:hypothetical protein
MHSNKATLKEASDGIKSQKLNDHKGLWRLCISLTCIGMQKSTQIKHQGENQNNASK